MTALGNFNAGDVLQASDLNGLANITVVRCASLLNIADGVGTIVPMAVSIVDTSGWHSTVTNNSRITPDIDGLYRLHASVQWGSSAIDESLSRFYVDGAGTPKSICRFVGTNIVGGHVNEYFVELTAGQYVEVYIVQNSGAGRPVDVQFSCELVKAS